MPPGKSSLLKSEQDLFSNLKSEFLNYDPAEFTRSKLRLDKEPFNVIDNGWRFMADIYRYIALQATTDKGKPVVICKGRQIGATVMGAALDLYFTNSGLFTTPPIRVAHLFPQHAQVTKFTQDKLEGLIRDADDNFINKNKLNSSTAVDNLTYKQFESGSLWVDSLGKDADRIRGMTLDVLLFDECFPYNQYIETENGPMKIGEIYDLFEVGKKLPRVKTYNEELNIFEFKSITHAWNRGRKNLFAIECDGIYFECTPEHKILTARGWVQANHINWNGSDYIKNNQIGYTRVTEAYELDESDSEIVYDIAVEDNHNFIILSKEDLNYGLVVSNCQDMLSLAIGNSTKTLTSAKYGPAGKGVQVFFGTPKERSSFFNTLWEMSDKRYYQLGCANCHKHFPFYQSGNDEWKSIWIEGHIILCPLCGHRQTKIQGIMLGKWVPSRDSEECKYTGFHINQLYHPKLSREYINDLMPQNNPAQSERVWNNEVIGEFYSGVGLPITKAEILEKCMDKNRSFSKKIDGKTKNTYLGVDWGEKVDIGKKGEPEFDRGQSYSCVVILSSNQDGILSIEHAHKLRQNNLNYKKDTISELYRRFGIKQGVSDWFYGQDVVQEMQLLFHDRLLGAQGSGQLIKSLRYRAEEMMISYNKDLLIDEVFSLFRNGKIRFPWQSYEHVEWLIDHCVSMETSVKMTNGQSLKTFAKGSIPNDGLMALMYAYIAYKFDITRGFSIKPGLEKESIMPKPILAYAPWLR